MSESPTTGTPAAFGPTGETPAVVEEEKVIGAVAYILTWVTGLIIFLIAKKEQRYARWNAVQAIGLGIVLVALAIVGTIVSSIATWVGGDIGAVVIGLVNITVWLGVVALIIVCAVKAYQGQPLRIPLLAGFADKYA